MKDYMECEGCGQTYVIDEVEYCQNIHYKLKMLCKKCQEVE
jgi:hypothetical protein